MMKRSAFAAVIPVFAFACGGGGGNAALEKNFNYGPATAPSTAEQTAASSALDGVTNAAAFSSSPNATSASSVVDMADGVVSSALGASVAFNGGAHLQNALSTAATIDTCTTVDTATSTVTFQNCTATESGVTVTLNGHVTGSPTSVSWSLQGSFSGVDSTTGYTETMNVDYSGSFTVSATTVKGNALVNLGATVSNGIQSVSLGVSEAVIVDVTYQSSPVACLTGGTIEAKRVWTQRPQGATSTDLPDLGVKLSWLACGNFNVQHSL